METQRFLCVWSCCTLCITLFVSGSPSHCIFGSRESGCLYPCHCKDGSEEGCDPWTGKCDSGTCIHYEGVSGSFYPWLNPGCHLGNILLGRSFHLRHKKTGAILQTATADPPYGSPTPPIHLRPTDPVSINEIEFKMDFGQPSFIQVVTLSSHYDTTAFFMSIVHGNCRVHAKIGNSDLNKTDCPFKLTAPKEPFSAICNAVGKYLFITATDCDLKASNVSNLYINEITVFGNPQLEINCLVCLKNDTSEAIESTIQYAKRVFKQHLTSEDNETLSSGWNCGNGIWCEECEAGYYPPDCKQICDRGYYGRQCMNTCIDMDIPDEYHCKGSKSDLCDPNTGKITGCSEGCETWYGGSDGLCQLYIGNISWNGYELTAEEVGSDWISMTFNTPDTIKPDIASFYRYYIEYREDGQVEWTLHPSVSQGITHNAKKCQMSVKVSALEKDTVYNFRMRLAREHQGHKLLEPLDDNSYNTVTTNCLKAPVVQCTTHSSQISWNLNQTTKQCESMTVTNMLYKNKGDSKWENTEIKAGQTEVELSDLKHGVFQAKLQGSIGDSGNIQLLSDEAECVISRFFIDFKLWNLNHVTVITFSVMLMVTIVVGICCYCCGKMRKSKLHNVIDGTRTDLLENRYDMAPSWSSTLPPDSCTKPTAGKNSRIFTRKDTTFIGKIKDNIEDTASTEYLNPVSLDVDNDLYCHLNEI